MLTVLRRLVSRVLPGRRALLLGCAGPVLALLPAVGCRATPGFQASLTFTQPPTLNQSAPVSAVEAPPVSYAVEEVQAWPRFARHPITHRYGAMGLGAAGDPCPPCPPCDPPPARMPQGKPSAPMPGEPCP